MSGRSALSAAARVTDPDCPGLVVRLGVAAVCRHVVRRRGGLAGS